MNLLDICERSEQGPLIQEKDFELKIFIPTLKEIVDKYEIQYARDKLFSGKNDTSDNVFRAAIEFLGRVGIYCIDTNRLIQFTEQEIIEAVNNAPAECILGEGQDAGIFSKRMIENYLGFRSAEGHPSHHRKL